MSERFQFEELDRETREYLMLARERKGKHMPGIFVAGSNYLPIVGMCLGFLIIVLTLLITFPPVLPPTKEACLQTAGFLLGGWMVVAAFRVWTSGKSGKYLGHFVYADAENLYEASGSTVRVTELVDLRHARSEPRYSNNKYQDTTIAMKIGAERQYVKVNDEERGRRLSVFLNAVSYMRDGGDDGKDDELRALTPETMGIVAKQVARTGEFPKNVRSVDDADFAQVPKPSRDGRRSTGLLGLLATLLIGAGMFFGFRYINEPLRDHAVFDQVKSLPLKDQPPALRVYLSNPAFKAHRDEAKDMLGKHYDNAVRAYVNGNDEKMKQGFADVILALKDKPQPVVSIVVSEEESPEGGANSASARERTVQTALADKWGSTVGDEMVVFAAPADPGNPNVMDKKSKGMIDLRWKIAPDGKIEFRIEFRRSPDEAPVCERTHIVENAEHVDAFQRADLTAQKMVDLILQMTVGGTRLRGPQIQVDF